MKQDISSYARNVNFNNGNCNNNDRSNQNSNNRVLAVSAFSTEYISLLEIYDAYFDCRKNKRWKKEAILFELDLFNNIKQLYYEINTKTYKIGQSSCFLVFKPKIREVFAENFRDRIIHHLVVKKLEPLFEKYFINSCYSCRKGKGTLYAQYDLYTKIYKYTEQYKKDCYIGKFDCSAFFMSIDKNVLDNKLKRFINENYFGKDKEILYWLCNIIILNHPEENCIFKMDPSKWKLLPKNKSLFYISSNKGIPIGNLTSLWFANLYLTEFDKFASQKFVYGRYVDDFYILASSRKECRKFYLDASKFLLENCKIKLNPNKIYILHYSKGVTFIGGVLRINRSYISNKTINRLYYFLKKNKFTEKDIASINSYLGLLSHYKSDIYLYKIKNLLTEQFKFSKKYAIYRT